jgi:hypothetical protein
VSSAAAVLAERIRASGARRVAFLGLAKNVGKTTALVSTLARLHAAGLSAGATSAGRDGEEFDAITGERKPRFRLWPGQLVASAESAFAAGSGGAELVRRLPFSTRFGSIEIRRMTSAGEVEVMGPTTSSQLSETAAALEGAGAECVLIDGAFGRRAFASARVADGIVLSVGLAAGASAETAMESARSAVGLIRLQGPPPGRPIRGVVGALTDEALSRQPPLSGSILLAEDFAAIFLSREMRRTLAQRDVTLAVERPARLLAVTANATAPGREPVSARKFFDGLVEALPGVALVDLHADLCHSP